MTGKTRKIKLKPNQDSGILFAAVVVGVGLMPSKAARLFQVSG
jgi:hypothetical protein